MPSLGSHLASAFGLAGRLGHPHIEAARDAYFLGATAPDIRVLLKVDRRETHFFDLEDFEPQDSVAAMFDAYPELGEAATLDEGTRAFIAGYITHLLMDEHYIQRVYRHYFGERSSLGGDLRANLLDRALQYEMNRRDLEDEGAMTTIRDAIDSAENAFGVPFIEPQIWPEWRDFTRGITYQRGDWERFPFVMRGHLKRAGYAEDEIEQAAADAPGLVHEALDHLTEEQLMRYLEEATEIAFERLCAYLPPPQ